VNLTEALSIEARHEQDCTIVTVTGEIDMSTVGGLRERLFELAASTRPLVTDLDQTSFIDSAGLGVLVGAANRAASHGGALQVVCAQPQVWQLFSLAGLDRRIPLTRTVDEARQALEARAAQS
jgi:anti-sigma B factor antagonist